ncbi:hypothetical protein GWK47_018548 [Chionoecetes opilio]|uniref:Uncharacterized protein n=1 Tax=Chionoecetes opilio TaxID=41210 RepID=A0A8J4XQF2_CHIOP|nr:hypothetical protein GWK47_018548 [Chionoecetes opilio]
MTGHPGNQRGKEAGARAVQAPAGKQRHRGAQTPRPRTLQQWAPRLEALDNDQEAFQKDVQAMAAKARLHPFRRHGTTLLEQKSKESTPASGKAFRKSKSVRCPPGGCNVCPWARCVLPRGLEQAFSSKNESYRTSP